MDVNKLITEYNQNPYDVVKDIEIMVKKKPNPILYTLLGTHYMNSDPDLAKKYLLKHIKHGPNGIGIYNLDYLYKQKVNQTQIY